MVNYNQLIADYSEARSTGEGLIGTIVSLMKNLFEKGNVDLLNRPKVSGMVMNGAGWDDVDDDDYATVYTLWYARGNDGESAMWMDDIILHVTPIKANGTVETPTHLDEYVDSLLAGTNSVAGLLEADKPANGGKGLVICVQKANDGWTKAKADADIYDEVLHQLQAAYYLNDLSSLPDPNDLETIADWFHVYSIYIKNYKDASGNYITTENRLYSVPIEPGEENIFIDPKVTGEMGKAGSFEFSMQPGHPYYESLCQMKTILRVTYDGDTIFRGRVLTIDTSHMNGMKKIHCEGDLAFLLDSQIEGVSDNDRPKTNALSYMNDLVSQHNAQMAEGMVDKRFTLGEVPGSYTGVTETEQRVSPDANYRYGSGSWRDSQSAWDDLANSFGGFIRTRYQNGTCFLDWLDQYYRSGVNPQVIELGSNLLELTSNSEVNNIFTAVIPVGSGENGKNLYINGYQTGIHGNNNRILVPQICQVFSDAQLNQGFHSKSDYQNAVNDYGIIYHTEAFSNADTQAKLWEYATDWIKNNYIGGLNSFNVSVLDMHNIDQSEGKFLVGDKVIVRYPDVNGRDNDPDAMVEKTLTVMSATYDLYHPEKNTYKIGIPNAVLKRTYGEKKNKKSRAASSSISTQLAEDELKNQAEEIWKESKELFDHETIWSMILTKSKDDPLYQKYQEKYGDEALAAVLAVPETILYESQYDSPLGEQSRKIISGILSGKDHTINLKGPINQAALQESGQLIDALVIDGLNHGVTVYQKPLSNAEGWKLLHPDPAAVLQAWLDQNTSSAKLTFSTGSFEQAVEDVVTKVSAQVDGSTGGVVGTGYKFGPLNKVEDILDKDAMGYLNAIGEQARMNGGNGKTYTFDITGMGGANNKSGQLSLATIRQGFAEATESFKTLIADGETGTQASVKQVLGTITNSQGDPEDIQKVMDGEKPPTIVVDGESKSIEVGTGLSQDSATIKIIGDVNNTGQGQEWIGRKENGDWRIFLNDNVTYTDVEGHSQNAYGFVSADDFKIKDTYNSLKSKLAVVDHLIAGQIDVAQLNAFKAKIDELYASKVDIEGMLTATSLFSGTAQTGFLNITGNGKSGNTTSMGLNVTGNASITGTLGAGTIGASGINVGNSGITFVGEEDDNTTYKEHFVKIGEKYIEDTYILANKDLEIDTSDILNAADAIATITKAEGLADGLIGFNYTTIADPNTSHPVNFNIADTAYYKGRVGIKSASATSGDIEDWQYWDEAVTFNGIDLSVSSVYNLIEVLGNNDGETKNKYSIRVNASGVLSEENVKATQTYLNDVGIDSTATTVVSGNWRDWSEDWDIPSAQQKTLSDQYGKVTVAANDGTSYVFGIDASDVYEAGVREGEGNVDTDAAYTSGYRTGYSKAQTVTENDARVSAYVDDVVYDNYTNYAASTNTLQISLKAYPKLKFKKLQNDSESIEPGSWDATPTDGTLWQDTVEFPMTVSPVELYKESFDGSKFVIRADGKTGSVTINGEEIDVPLKNMTTIDGKSYPLAIPISGSINSVSAFEWHDKEGDPYRYKYTFKMTGTVKSNNDTLIDLKKDDYMDPSFAINYGKSRMGVSGTWTKNVFSYSVVESTKKSGTFTITSYPSFEYDSKNHVYKLSSSSFNGDTKIDGSAPTVEISTGDTAYQDGLRQGRSESQTVYGEITDIALRKYGEKEYLYDEDKIEYTVYLRATGTNLDATANPDGGFNDSVTIDAETAFEKGRELGRTEVTPVTVYGKITNVGLRKAGGVKYAYSDDDKEYTIYLQASGENLDPSVNPGGVKDGQDIVDATAAFDHGMRSVYVTAASIVANLDVYTGDYSDIPVDVTLNNNKSTTINVDMSPIYQDGLDGKPEITNQEFEFEFVDDDGAYVVVDDPYFSINVNKVWKNGERDRATPSPYGYGLVYTTGINRAGFAKALPTTDANMWGYINLNNEVEFVDDKIYKSDGVNFRKVKFDGFIGYISVLFISETYPNPTGRYTGWYNNARPVPKIVSVSIDWMKHDAYSYDGNLAVRATTSKPVETATYSSEGVYNYSSINTTSGVVVSNYLKQTAYTGYYGTHSNKIVNSGVAHKIRLKVNYDFGDPEYVVIEASSKNVAPSETIISTDIYHSDEEYTGSISVGNLGTSEAMRYTAFDALELTAGENISSYYSGSFTHSSSKYSGSLHHKVQIGLLDDFGNSRTVVVACTSTAAAVKLKSFTVRKIYNAGNYATTVKLTDFEGYAIQQMCETSGYANIDTTGESADTFFTGYGSYAYNPNYPVSMTCRVVLDATYSDDSTKEGIVVEVTARREAKPAMTIKYVNIVYLVHDQYYYKGSFNIQLHPKYDYSSGSNPYSAKSNYATNISTWGNSSGYKSGNMSDYFSKASGYYATNNTPGSGEEDTCLHKIVVDVVKSDGYTTETERYMLKDGSTVSFRSQYK